MNRHRSEAGFALLEVIVSAAVLALVAVAVLAGIDGAQSSTGREKARSVAANLAEQDQERLRSLQVDSLADYTETRTVNVDGSNYTVVSTGSWVRDDTGGTVSCQNNSKQADYLQITSTVTNSSIGTRTAPVVIKSLSAPSVAYSTTRGSLAVQVNNRDGAGVPAINVHIAGTSSGTVSRDALTNSVGCALFQYVPAGDYTASTTRSGWVDKAGKSPASKSTTLTAGTVGLVNLDYDQAAGATLTIKTYTPGTTTAIPSSSVDAAEINPGDPAMRTFPPAPPANPTATIPAANLFPFKDAYTFWTGSCAGENPASYAGNSTYFSGPGNHALPTSPGGLYTLDVFQPPLNVRVSQDARGREIGNGSTDNMTYSALYTETGCTDRVTLYPVTRTISGSPSYGWLSQQPGSYDPGLPFGKWKVCVNDLSRGKNVTVASYDNTAPGGQGTTTTLSSYVTGTATC